MSKMNNQHYNIGGSHLSNTHKNYNRYFQIENPLVFLWMHIKSTWSDLCWLTVTIHRHWTMNCIFARIYINKIEQFPVMKVMLILFVMPAMVAMMCRVKFTEFMQWGSILHLPFAAMSSFSRWINVNINTAHYILLLFGKMLTVYFNLSANIKVAASIKYLYCVQCAVYALSFMFCV